VNDLTIQANTPHIKSMTDKPSRKPQPWTRRALMTNIGVTTLGLSGLVGAAQAAVPTPWQVEGPFYPEASDLVASNADLTERAPKGDIIDVSGRVMDRHGQTLPRIRVELWQADAKGRYRHLRDGMAHDPNFDGFGQVTSDAEGAFAFRTVMPGAYAISSTNWRTAHIHFKIWLAGRPILTTQMYFPDQKLNSRDMFLPNLPPDQRDQATASEDDQPSPFGKGATRHYGYDIHLS